MQRDNSEGSTPKPEDILRADRDRFVALAFCASDILIELDAALRVVYVAGATVGTLGAVPQALIGRSFLDIVAEPDRDWAKSLLAAAVGGERIRDVRIRLQSGSREPAPLALVGYHMPDLGRYYLALHIPGGQAQGTPVPGTGRLTPSGLPDGPALADSAGTRLKALGPAAKAYKLTMLRLDGLIELEERLESETSARLLKSVGEIVREASLGGDTAGQFDTRTFGFVHAISADTAALTERVRAAARSVDPDGEGIHPIAAQLDLDLDLDGMSRDDAARACLYVFDRFVSQGDDFQLTSLSAGLSALINDTVDRVQEFRTVVRDHRFRMVFQPVVDLVTRQIQHYEALARFDDFGPTADGPYQTITFAERSGLICDFDLAMCAKVLRWLEDERAAGLDHRVAVNISGRSIGSPAFVDGLHRQLREHPSLRGNVLFEITESARIPNLEAVAQVVRGLRDAGHKVCLDDFGAGASAFSYLRALDVDVVKIDGIYVRDALKMGKGKSFLKAMAGLCNDLGIVTVAEMIENANAVTFLRACGVAYGQGYLFGRPSEDISVFDPRRRAPVKPVPLGKRVVGRSRLGSSGSHSASRED
ncbi:MAG TPA: EAL domain-containing protein [Alphaproteobacteria bacterium]|jgi:EAL domain-containing protein (putative c-di-GMP-specific phosphodiesterase class I)|nr:EAL domain-containing protein [Alphaproteobacteria bacterium]